MVTVTQLPCSGTRLSESQDWQHAPIVCCITGGDSLVRASAIDVWKQDATPALHAGAHCLVRGGAVAESAGWHACQGQGNNQLVTRRVQHIHPCTCWSHAAAVGAYVWPSLAVATITVAGTAPQRAVLVEADGRRSLRVHTVGTLSLATLLCCCCVCYRLSLCEFTSHVRPCQDPFHAPVPLCWAEAPRWPGTAAARPPCNPPAHVRVAGV